MKKLSSLLLFIMAVIGLNANDGAFLSNGNHLIPISDSDISVKKEILTITLADDTVSWGKYFIVNVYYEFYNAGEAKDVLVGFEAPSPDGNGCTGDVNTMYQGDPWIYDFQVVMNGKKLPYQIAHVPYKYEGGYNYDYTIRKDDYYKNGKIQDMSLEQYNAMIDTLFEDPDECWEFYGVLFYYVYHFNAHFEPGLNIIQHTYTSKGSSLVMMDYVFNYILTAANRWANNGIDDFTLIVDMGERTSFACGIKGVDPHEWMYNGNGRRSEYSFHIQSGTLVLHKEKFHPEGELAISKGSNYSIGGTIDYIKSDYLDLYEEYYKLYTKNIKSNEEKRILKNLPFAYRGYVFKDQGLQDFFESTDWYIPNPEYKPDMNAMSKDEREWIQAFSN